MPSLHRPAAHACACLPKHHVARVQHLRDRRFTYWLCQACGEEWTTSEQVADLSLPVSCDEILDVRAALSQSDFTLQEITSA